MRLVSYSTLVLFVCNRIHIMYTWPLIPTYYGFLRYKYIIWGGTGVAADAGVVAVLINAEMVLDMIKSSIYNI